jgi:hypothetical protein
MISAFGIEHGDINKALKPHHLQALQRAEKTIAQTSNSQKGYYAQNRINLHAMGKKGRKSRYGNEDTASFKAEMSHATNTPKYQRGLRGGGKTYPKGAG